MKLIFLDTAIPMYAGGAESRYKKKCREILEKAAKEELDGVTDVEVFQEILYRYYAIGQLGAGHEIFGHFKQIVSKVFPVIDRDVFDADELLTKYPGVPPRDLIHVAVMLNNGITTICSPDTDFDTIGEIKRVDPLEF